MPDYLAHPTAILDPPVHIGRGTRIWHFCHVMPHATLGEHCSLGQNVFVAGGVSIGDRVRIQNNVSVYEGVTVEDDVFLGPSCVFTNVNNPRAELPRRHVYRPTVVRRGATVGANATIICGVTLGRYAFVGAGAVVSRDVPDYALVVGVPARQSGWMSRHGERLPEPDADGFMACPASRWRYREVVPGGLRCVDWPEDAPLPEPSACLGDAPIPFVNLRAQRDTVRSEVDAAVGRVLDSQHFILGPEVEALEASLAALTKSHFAIGVSSGTDALLVALLALGVGPGDEVITTPFSFFATAGVISRLGARPVFVDIDRATFTMSPTGLEDAMTERTKAVLPVHLFGQTAAMEEILTITRSRGIAVVEDAAQALGASYDGSPAGSLGTLGCFSFFPTKNLGAYGDGGLVTTNDAALAERVRSLRTHGQTARYVHEAIGGNFRLDALQAAVLRAKLPFFDRWTATRRRYASLYLRELGGCTRVVLPVEAPRCLHVYHQFVLRSDDRDGLRAFLASRGIASEVYYPVPLHLQPCFRDLGAGAFPESERAAREVLALPIVPELTEAEVLRVARTVLEYLGT